MTPDEIKQACTEWLEARVPYPDRRVADMKSKYTLWNGDPPLPTNASKTFVSTAIDEYARTICEVAPLPDDDLHQRMIKVSDQLDTLPSCSDFLGTIADWDHSSENFSEAVDVLISSLAAAQEKFFVLMGLEFSEKDLIGCEEGLQSVLGCINATSDGTKPRRRGDIDCLQVAMNVIFRRLAFYIGSPSKKRSSNVSGSAASPSKRGDGGEAQVMRALKNIVGTDQFLDAAEENLLASFSKTAGGSAATESLAEKLQKGSPDEARAVFKACASSAELGALPGSVKSIVTDMSMNCSMNHPYLRPKESQFRNACQREFRSTKGWQTGQFLPPLSHDMFDSDDDADDEYNDVCNVNGKRVRVPAKKAKGYQQISQCVDIVSAMGAVGSLLRPVSTRDQQDDYSLMLAKLSSLCHILTFKNFKQFFGVWCESYSSRYAVFMLGKTLDVGGPTWMDAFDLGHVQSQLIHLQTKAAKAPAGVDSKQLQALESRLNKKLDNLKRTTPNKPKPKGGAEAAGEAKISFKKFFAKVKDIPKADRPCFKLYEKGECPEGDACEYSHEAGAGKLPATFR